MWQNWKRKLRIKKHMWLLWSLRFRRHRQQHRGRQQLRLPHRQRRRHRHSSRQRRKKPRQRQKNSRKSRADMKLPFILIRQKRFHSISSSLMTWMRSIIRQRLHITRRILRTRWHFLHGRRIIRKKIHRHWMRQTVREVRLRLQKNRQGKPMKIWNSRCLRCRHWLIFQGILPVLCGIFQMGQMLTAVFPETRQGLEWIWEVMTLWVQMVLMLLTKVMKMTATVEAAQAA